MKDKPLRDGELPAARESIRDSRSLQRLPEVPGATEIFEGQRAGRLGGGGVVANLIWSLARGLGRSGPERRSDGVFRTRRNHGNGLAERDGFGTA